jgi:hypothetical protein
MPGHRPRILLETKRGDKISPEVPIKILGKSTMAARKTNPHSADDEDRGHAIRVKWTCLRYFGIITLKVE